MWILVGVFLLGLVVFHTLERVAPVLRGYPRGLVRRGYWADLAASAVNGPGLTAIEKIAFFWLVTRLPAWQNVLGPRSWAAQFALFFIVNDLARYWLHRWYHNFSILWRIHRVHHTVVEMDALSVFRHHVLEAIVKNGLIFLPFRLLGVADSVIIAYSAIDIFKGFWHHANLRSYIGPLNYVFNSPELHWWHHSIEARGQGANFGSILSVWDWLFRTAYWPRGQWPQEIGVEGMRGFPDSYVGQLVSIRYGDEQARRRFGAVAPQPPGACAGPERESIVQPAVAPGIP